MTDAECDALVTGDADGGQWSPGERVLIAVGWYRTIATLCNGARPAGRGLDAALAAAHVRSDQAQSADGAAVPAHTWMLLCQRLEVLFQRLNTDAGHLARRRPKELRARGTIC